MLDAAIWAFAPLLTLLALVGIGANLVPTRWAGTTAPASAMIIAGLLAVAATVMAVNLLLPLGTQTAPVTMFAGTVGIIVALRRRILLPAGLIDVATTSLAATVLYRLSSPVIPIRFFTDTVGYHLSHMEWLANEPMPIGNAIIQTRLGLNPGFMTVVSALRWEPLGHTHLFTTEIVVRALFLLVVLEALRATDVRDERLQGTITAIAVASLPFFAINKNGTDGNIGFMLLVLALLALMAARERNDSERAHLIVLMFAALGLTVTFKLSAATAVLLLAPAVARSRRTGSLSLIVARPHIPLIVLTGVTLSGWLVRGLAATGCLAFPLGLTCAPVSWGVGSEDASFVSRHITEFARRSSFEDGAGLLGFHWVSDWIATYLTSVPALVVLLALPIAVIGRLRRGSPLRVTGVAWVLLAALPAGLIALSVADLLGGRRFLGVNPAVVAILDDYPLLNLIVLIPIIALCLALVAAATAPLRPVRLGKRDAPQGLRIEDRSDPDPVRVLGPYLVASLLYWFLAAPGVRFAWAPHALVAGLLLTGWLNSIDLERLRIHRLWRSPASPKGAIGFATLVVFGVLVPFGLVEPVAPLSAPPADVAHRTTLLPAEIEVLSPAAAGGCSTAFPCAPAGARGIEAERSFGRIIFRRVDEQRNRLRVELEIIPTAP